MKMSMPFGRSTITTSVSSPQRRGVAGAVLVAAAFVVYLALRDPSIELASQETADLTNTVLGWVTGAVLAAGVLRVAWSLRDDIPWSGQARQVAAWSASVDRALAYQADWDAALAEERERVLVAAEAALAEPDEFGEPKRVNAAAPEMPDELAARRVTRGAEAG